MIKFITLENGKFVATSSIIQKNTLYGNQNQILINGGTQQNNIIIGTKSVTLSLPQDISTTSDVQFNEIVLQNGVTIIGGNSSFNGNIELGNQATLINNPVRADRIVYLTSSFQNIITSQNSNNLTSNITMSIGWEGQLQLSKGGTNTDLSSTPVGSLLSINDNKFVSIDNVQNSTNRIPMFVQNNVPILSKLHYLDSVPYRSIIYVKQKVAL